MAAGSPSLGRATLGAALKELRDKSKLSQAALGKLIGRSQSWVAKIENAQIIDIEMLDLDAIIEALQIPARTASSLREMAMAPYDKRGLYAYSLNKSDIISASLGDLTLRARSIGAFHAEVHNGLTQCKAYIQRMYELSKSSDVSGAVNRRLAYQKGVLKQANPPKVEVVLSEAALKRDLGDPKLMNAQIRHLQSLAKRGVVDVRVLPFDSACAPSTGDFVSYQFDPEIMTDFVSVEIGRIGSTVIDDEQTVDYYSRRLAEVMALASKPEQTLDVLGSYIK